MNSADPNSVGLYEFNLSDSEFSFRERYERDPFFLFSKLASILKTAFTDFTKNHHALAIIKEVATTHVAQRNAKDQTVVEALSSVISTILFANTVLYRDGICYFTGSEALHIHGFLSTARLSSSSY